MNGDFNKDRRKGERRKILRRREDKAHAQEYRGKIRKLQSLLDLGQLIGLDLKLNEMLRQISQKACEVMGADRCTIFLHNPGTDELWSTVALGMAGEVISMPSTSGLAGHCFLTGETINLEDAYGDKRFNIEVDLKTGYRTRSVLCMPLYYRSGSRLGVIELLNKEDRLFTKEDETFLQTFGNHASVFIEIAQLQRARIDALEQSRKELDQLNRAKSKALDHLSHELSTPLAVIRGNIQLLKRKIQVQTPPLVREGLFKALEENLSRLSRIQQETDQIIRSHIEMERLPRLEELGIYNPDMPETIPLYPLIERILEDIRKQARLRDLEITLEGARDFTLGMAPKILEEIIVGILKNAIENTPDEGMIRIVLEQKDDGMRLKVIDSGIGIIEEDQRYLFDGLFHTLNTDLYASKKPYDFGAGGKGLDLLRIKNYGRRFGFDLSVESRRCPRIPTDRDLCPGKISKCSHCKTREDCLATGGSTFCVAFQLPHPHPNLEGEGNR